MSREEETSLRSRLEILDAYVAAIERRLEVSQAVGDAENVDAARTRIREILSVSETAAAVLCWTCSGVGSLAISEPSSNKSGTTCGASFPPSMRRLWSSTRPSCCACCCTRAAPGAASERPWRAMTCTRHTWSTSRAPQGCPAWWRPRRWRPAAPTSRWRILEALSLNRYPHLRCCTEFGSCGRTSAPTTPHTQPAEALECALLTSDHGLATAPGPHCPRQHLAV